MEEKKKSNVGLIVLVVILLLACVGMGAFIFVNKDKLITKNSASASTEKNSSNKKKKSQEKDDKIADKGSQKKHDVRGTNNLVCGAPLVSVEAGRHKAEQLIEHVGRGKEQACVGRSAHVGHKLFRQSRVDKMDGEFRTAHQTERNELARCRGQYHGKEPVLQAECHDGKHHNNHE